MEEKQQESLEYLRQKLDLPLDRPAALQRLLALRQCPLCQWALKTLEDNAVYETALSVAAVPSDQRETLVRERTFGFAEGLRAFGKLLDSLEQELSQSQPEKEQNE